MTIHDMSCVLHSEYCSTQCIMVPEHQEECSRPHIICVVCLRTRQTQADMGRTQVALRWKRTLREHDRGIYRITWRHRKLCLSGQQRWFVFGRSRFKFRPETGNSHSDFSRLFSVMSIYSSYKTENMLSPLQRPVGSCYLEGKKIAVYCENNPKHINTEDK